jgi:tRNA(Ile)-lysidine synthase
MVPEPALAERFRKELDALIAPEAQIGIGVSGGPDSLALLLLAAYTRPGQIEAATVDHRLRPESADEASVVAQYCEKLGVPHAILGANWNDKPTSAIQERARRERYRLLGYWAEERGLDAIATAHHADDQAETLLMRLARGAGVRGLAGMRPRSRTPGSDMRLIRPLLGWRRTELAQICHDAGVAPVVDPSNADEQFERVRIRLRMAGNEWLDAAAIAKSASHLADAQTALEWAARREWKQAVKERSSLIAYQPSDAPSEIVRRIVARAVSTLATEGDTDLRGRELDHLLDTLGQGEAATLRGVRCEGGREWRFTPAPIRRGG